jgi:uncharacterized protein (TIGR04255 family)
MDQCTLYSRSPIVEARIDIKVQLPPEIEVFTLMEMASAVESEYAIEHQCFKIDGKIDVNSNLVASASAQNNLVGYAFVSDDKQKRFEVRNDGFTFRHSSPYPGWNIFKDRANEVWEIYREIAQPTQIDLLALRYINRIDIPSTTGFELKNYLRTFAEISTELPQNPQTWFVHLQIPGLEDGSNIFITQAMIPPESPNVLSVALDIHIIKEGILSEESPNIWQNLNIMHGDADRVFEASISDTTRELIK